MANVMAGQQDSVTANHDWCLVGQVLDENDDHDDGGDDEHDDEHDKDDCIKGQQPSSTNLDETSRYSSRKPTWWLRLSGNPTKAQKRALRELEHLRISKPVYGTILDWTTVFSQRQQQPQTIWYEIGCGNGDNLLALSRLYPERCLVGAEVHKAGAGALLQHIRQGLEGSPYQDYSLHQLDEPHEAFSVNDNVAADAAAAAAAAAAQLSNVPSQDSSSNDSLPFSNIRVFVGDGIGLLDRIPLQTLDAILITFPDPFAKENEANLRVFQIHTVQAMHERLRQGGRLYLATDHVVFNEWAHDIVRRVNDVEPCFRLVTPCPDRRFWLPVVSKYEQKGLDEGRMTMLSCWEKTNDGVDELEAR